MSAHAVRVPNRVVDLHLRDVVWQMRDLGPPTIRVYGSGDDGPSSRWRAATGSRPPPNWACPSSWSTCA